MHVTEAACCAFQGPRLHSALQGSVSNLYSQVRSSFLKNGSSPPLYKPRAQQNLDLPQHIYIILSHVYHEGVSVSLPLSPPAPTSFFLSLFPFFPQYLCSRSFPFWDRGTVRKKTSHSREVQGVTGACGGASPLHPGTIRKVETGRIEGSAGWPDMGWDVLECTVDPCPSVSILRHLSVHLCVYIWV